MTLPEDAQTLYVQAYNEALARDDLALQGSLSPEAAAHAVAWQAIEEQFEQNERDGKWYRKGELEEVQTEESDGGLVDKIKNLF
jgi:cation transport regulator ChaB